MLFECCCCCGLTLTYNNEFISKCLKKNERKFSQAKFDQQKKERHAKVAITMEKRVSDRKEKKLDDGMEIQRVERREWQKKGKMKCKKKTPKLEPVQC